MSHNNSPGNKGDDKNHVVHQQNLVEQQNNIVEPHQQNMSEEQRKRFLDSLVEEQVSKPLERHEMLNFVSRIRALKIYYELLKETKDETKRDASREESSGSSRLG